MVLSGIRALSLFSLMLLMCGCGTDEPEIHFYTWVNYIKPSLIDRFEKEQHCRLVINTFDSNESMFAKLQLGATGYDLITSSNYYAPLLIEQGMLEPFDPSLLPNIQYLDPTYVKKLEPQVAAYGIPFLITPTGIAYRKDKIGYQYPSWGIFDQKALKGRLTMLNDPREAIGAALKFLGYSLNTTNELEINEAVGVLINWKKNLAKFESEQYKDGIASGEFLAVQGFMGELLLVSDENPEVTCVLPEEGAILSIDIICISKDFQHKELVYAFLNYLMDPEVAAENIAFTKFLIPNTAAYEKLPLSLKNNQILFPTGGVAANSELIKNIGPASTYYNKAWDKVKSAE